MSSRMFLRYPIWREVDDYEELFEVLLNSLYRERQR